MSSNRHLSRIAVVQALFSWEFREGEGPEKMLDYILNQLHPKLTQLDFARANMKGIISNREKIQEIIESMAPEWSFDKIAAIDRAILEQGTYEIVYEKEVPPVVAINESIEIAKVMGSENAPKFVNGVLSSVMKKYRPNNAKKANESK